MTKWRLICLKCNTEYKTVLVNGTTGKYYYPSTTTMYYLCKCNLTTI